MQLLYNNNILGPFLFLELGLSLGCLFLWQFLECRECPSQGWCIFSVTWTSTWKITIIYIIHSALLWVSLFAFFTWTETGILISLVVHLCALICLYLGDKKHEKRYPHLVNNCSIILNFRNCGTKVSQFNCFLSPLILFIHACSSFSYIWKWIWLLVEIKSSKWERKDAYLCNKWWISLSAIHWVKH